MIPREYKIEVKRGGVWTPGVLLDASLMGSSCLVWVGDELLHADRLSVRLAEPIGKDAERAGADELIKGLKQVIETQKEEIAAQAEVEAARNVSLSRAYDLLTATHYVLGLLIDSNKGGDLTVLTAARDAQARIRAFTGSP